MVRKAAKVSRKKCGIYIDLQGPRIRLGDIQDKKPSIKVKAGQTFLLYCKKKVMGNDSFIGVENTELAKKVKEGIRAAGGTPIEFNTIAVSDGIFNVLTLNVSIWFARPVFA